MGINVRKAVSILVVSAVWLNLAGAVTVMAQEEPPSASEPSEAHMYKLVVTPIEVGIGEATTIRAILEKTGGGAVTYTVELRINGVVEATEKKFLFADYYCPACGVHTSAGTEETRFTVARDMPGTYVVEVNGLSDSFEVKEKAALLSLPTQEITPAPGPEASQQKPANPSFIGGIAGAVIIQGLIIFLLLMRKKAQNPG